MSALIIKTGKSIKMSYKCDIEFIDRSPSYNIIVVDLPFAPFIDLKLQLGFNSNSNYHYKTVTVKEIFYDISDEAFTLKVEAKA
jgi:hypothetical protein